MKAQEIRTFGAAFNGKTPSKAEQRKEGLPILKIRDIDENGQFRGSFESFVDQKYYEKHTKKKLKTGDTIILNAAHNRDYVGSKNAFIPSELNGVIATGEWLIVRVDEADPAFVSYFLKSPLGRENLKNCVKGIHLYPKDVERIKVPLPPLDDQKRIAYVLGKVEGLIAQRKQHLQQLDDLLKSIFLEMFGDPVRNEKGWDKKPMGTLMNIVRGGSPRPINKFLGGTYPWIKIGDATKGDEIYIHETKEHIIEDGLKKTRLLPAGSLIFANCGVSLGFARIITFEGCIHDGWLAFFDIQEESLNKIFILKALNQITQYFRILAPDGTQPNLNTGIMKRFDLIVPPINLQGQFAAVVEKVGNIKSTYQQSLADLENLYGALSQKAFKGELDLSRVPLPSEDTDTTAAEPPEVRESPSPTETFNLPAPPELTPLHSTEGRQDLINQWLAAWLTHLNDAPFSPRPFIEAAQQRLIELAEEEDLPDWSTAEYNTVQTWVFEALGDQHLTQTYDDAKNRVQLQTTSPR